MEIASPNDAPQLVEDGAGGFDRRGPQGAIPVRRGVAYGSAFAKLALDTSLPLC
jgi:hypothetical protein